MLKTTIEFNERERAIAENTITAMLDLIDPLTTDDSVEARYDLKLLLNKFKKTSMEKTTKNCRFCGEEILLKAIKCKHCGEMLTVAQDKTDKTDKDKDREKTKSFRISKEKNNDSGIIWFLAIGGLFFFPLWIVLAVILIIRAINKNNN